MSRNIYEKPKVGEITQGAIFSGAHSYSFSDVECFGVVITARCSIDHGKMPRYHYLPVIPFSKWKEQDFYRLLKKEVYNNHLNKLNTLLRNYSLSTNVCDYFDLSHIKDTLSPLFSKEKDRKSFIETIDTLLSLNNSSCGLETLAKQFPKCKSIVINRLLSNDYLNYYLIESWDQTIDHYFVILLDEVRTIFEKDFFQLAKGLDYTYWLTNEVSKRSDIRKLATEDLLYVHSVIKSPFIEHVIQRFSHNFCRVGVQDFHELTSQHLMDIV